MPNQIIAGNFISIAAVLPIVVLGITTGIFWSSLQRPLLYLFVGVVLVYAVMITCLYPILTNIGLSGAPRRAPSSGSLDPADWTFLKAFLLFVVFAVALLYALRLLFARRP